MKSSLRVGAGRAPKAVLLMQPAGLRPGKTRRIASLSAVVAVIFGVGASSAVFVDYLADRALARAAEASPQAAVVAKESGAADSAAPGGQIVADAGLADARPAAEPVVRPVRTQIVAAVPAPAEAARVAATVGPEHAIELPTEDPTASPILQLDETLGDAPAAETGVEAAGLPVNADEEIADDTFTAAISPQAEAIPEVAPKPKRPPKAAKSGPASEAKPADTRIASLPGVDIGGFAGNPAPPARKSAARNSAIVKTVVKGGSARVAKAVNLRTRPENGAGVIMVVPAKADVKVLGCENWCQISYKGKKGWVYKSFIAASQRTKSGGTPTATRQTVTSSRL